MPKRSEGKQNSTKGQKEEKRVSLIQPEDSRDKSINGDEGERSEEEKPSNAKEQVSDKAIKVMDQDGRQNQKRLKARKKAKNN